MKRFFDNLEVTFDKIKDTSEGAAISPSNGINYCLIVTAVLLEIAYLLLQVVLVIKYCMRGELTIPCLSSY